MSINFTHNHDKYDDTQIQLYSREDITQTR